MKRVLLAAISIAAIVSLFVSPLTSAQSGSGGGQALEIGPPVLNLTADPGQVITSSINVRNVSTSAMLVSSQVNDFEASGEDGTPQLLLDQTEESPFSIRSWLQPLDQLTLESRQLKAIPLTIYVPETAAPGGYYGIIRFTGTPVGVDGNGVSLNASLGTLIFIRVSGQAKEQLSVQDFYANSRGNEYPIYELKPVTLSVRIKNEGNIYEQPTGIITVKNMFGKNIVNLPVNAEERIILPNSVRRFDQVVDDTAIGPGLMFGRYTAELTIKYGSSGQEVTSTASFWVIPYKLILLGVIGIVVLYFVFRILIKRYNQHIVQKATGVKPTKANKEPKRDAKPPEAQGQSKKRRFGKRR